MSVYETANKVYHASHTVRFCAQTLWQRLPAGATVVVKAIKARAPMLVVNRGVMVFRSVCSSQVVRQHRCSRDFQCGLAVDITRPNLAHSPDRCQVPGFELDSPSVCEMCRKQADSRQHRHCSIVEV